ncbi:hypothetical protein BU23DRAFT_550957 [Bimuria novae-zelandiae CBS 107.79]|uniref:ELYS-like domain-containing protein n=1 Tax=Bimuria novae-zelandiae CBS 107.79 TaxID=1447943 RepID=A0A6A5VQ30_9PLEO|nr:hypothetical protein BU23DRAFT_550957 [Bimuria novae-zelandiae CBS 107.79]
MIDIEDYDALFPHGSYTEALRSDIQDSQSTLGGRTFFERLLDLLNIQWRKMYPPQGDDGLRKLHKRICDAPSPLHYKHCLIFYLLRDLSPHYKTSPEWATQFANNVHLETRFWTFVEGIWELDHLQFNNAVGHLTHPSIIPTFPDEILLTLLNRRHHQLSGMNETDILPLAYYNCVKPPLASDAVRQPFVKYLAARNVTEAYYWIRARPDHEHRQLLEALIEQTLDHSTWAGGDAKELEHIYPKQEKAIELVGLPFSEEEEEWLEKFLTEGKGRTLRAAEDTVLMRRIATGRLHSFVSSKVNPQKAHNGVDWDILKNGVKRGLGPREGLEDFKD